MAEKKYLNEKKLQQELFKRTEGYAYSVRAIYLDALNRVINIVKGTELEDGKPFSFSGYGYSEQVTPIFRQMYSRVYQTIRGGVQAEWLNSNEHTDDLVKAVFGASSIEDHHFARYFKRNQDAMEAFFARKSADGGLNLSQRVWKYVSPYREELENTLDLAIGEGTPAMRLASKVKEYLNDPDRWYRRFRYKAGEDEDGKPIYGLKWKRRIFDKQNGLYQWVDDNPKHYHPGQGVYRSSARNAQRLARTETNIAYRTADYERWQQLDFVIGMRVRLSNNHPVTDICDLMADKLFPKDFKWTGWHPNCRCYMEPVLATEEDMDTMLDNILDGKEPTDNLELDGEVKEMPEEFVEWVKANEERMEAARERGTLPYFVRDNESLVAAALGGDVQGAEPTILEKAAERHKARTSEEIERIRKAWETRKEAISLGDSVLSDLDGISDVDTTELRNQLDTAHYAQALEEIKRLQVYIDELKNLEYVDNGLALAKQYSYAEIKGCDEAIIAKLQKWATSQGYGTWADCPLEYKLKKLNYEVVEWYGKNPQAQLKYKTWQVAETAYAKQLQIVKDEIWWKEIKANTSSIYAPFAKVTTSVIYKSALADLNQAIVAQDKEAAQKAMAALDKKKASLEKAAATRARNKAGAFESETISFDESNFTKERKNGAIWAKDDGKLYDDYMRDQAGDLWIAASDHERYSMHKYTYTYNFVNEPLRGMTYYGSEADGVAVIKSMTDYIGRSRLTRDTWLMRYDDAGGIRGRFGIDLTGLTEAEAQKYVGTVGYDGAFLSTGSAKRKGLKHGSTIATSNIYCPKGTQAAYAEPYSRYGSHKTDGKWDGKTKQSTFSTEFETILQRGGKYRITKIYKEGDMWYIDQELIGQLQ